MPNGSHTQRSVPLLAGLALLGLAALPADAQSARPANCYAYQLDEKSGKIIFNDPRVTILMPEKKERDRVRSQGTPAQVFLMHNCDAPDTLADLKVYSEASENGDPELIPSASRVIVLAEKGDWVQVKGHTGWKGSGWIKREDKLVIVRY